MVGNRFQKFSPVDLLAHNRRTRAITSDDVEPGFIDIYPQDLDLHGDYLILSDALSMMHTATCGAGHPITDLALAVIARRGFAVKTVADTLGVSRSHLHSRLREGSRPRGRYQKSEDAALLAAIRTLTDDRPTYGYRRIWALLNRERQSAGFSRLNHKRIYRLMSQNGLLLQRYTGKPPGRAHDGQIFTIRPNLRWTSDGFEIACWNGQSVRVAFALDTCDREVMSGLATTGGISGEMIRDLILENVERRFNSQQTPHPVEWLLG
jgi:transposase InsO family protein